LIDIVPKVANHIQDWHWNWKVSTIAKIQIKVVLLRL